MRAFDFVLQLIVFVIAWPLGVLLAIPETWREASRAGPELRRAFRAGMDAHR